MTACKVHPKILDAVAHGVSGETRAVIAAIALESDEDPRLVDVNVSAQSEVQSITSGQGGLELAAVTAE